tara:strand:- start:73 stop:378 length:306 start_codon:yes stop_codon:yes gene_type:complete
MEKVWRPFSFRERRPVTPLNGAISGCFRKKSAVFVNKCKTGNSLPLPAAAFWQTLMSNDTSHGIFFHLKQPPKPKKQKLAYPSLTTLQNGNFTNFSRQGFP